MEYVTWALVFVVPWLIGMAAGRWTPSWKMPFFVSWMGFALLGFWLAGSGLLPVHVANGLAVRTLIGTIVFPLIYWHGYRNGSRIPYEVRRTIR